MGKHYLYPTSCIVQTQRHTLQLFHVIPGRGQDNGEGPGAHAALRAQVHADEGQHPGRGAQDPDAEVPEHHGHRHARRHARHGHHEPPAQHAADTEDTAGVYCICYVAMPGMKELGLKFAHVSVTD